MASLGCEEMTYKQLKEAALDLLYEVDTSVPTDDSSGRRTRATNGDAAAASSGSSESNEETDTGFDESQLNLDTEAEDQTTKYMRQCLSRHHYPNRDMKSIGRSKPDAEERTIFEVLDNQETLNGKTLSGDEYAKFSIVLNTYLSAKRWGQEARRALRLRSSTSLHEIRQLLEDAKDNFPFIQFSEVEKLEVLLAAGSAWASKARALMAGRRPFDVHIGAADMLRVIEGERRAGTLRAGTVSMEEVRALLDEAETDFPQVYFVERNLIQDHLDLALRLSTIIQERVLSFHPATTESASTSNNDGKADESVSSSDATPDGYVDPEDATASLETLQKLQNPRGTRSAPEPTLASMGPVRRLTVSESFHFVRQFRVTLPYIYVPLCDLLVKEIKTAVKLLKASRLRLEEPMDDIGNEELRTAQRSLRDIEDKCSVLGISVPGLEALKQDVEWRKWVVKVRNVKEQLQQRGLRGPRLSKLRQLGEEAIRLELPKNNKLFVELCKTIESVEDWSSRAIAAVKPPAGHKRMTLDQLKELIDELKTIPAQVEHETRLLKCIQTTEKWKTRWAKLLAPERKTTDESLMDVEAEDDNTQEDVEEEPEDEQESESEDDSGEEDADAKDEALGYHYMSFSEFRFLVDQADSNDMAFISRTDCPSLYEMRPVLEAGQEWIHKVTQVLHHLNVMSTKDLKNREALMTQHESRGKSITTLKEYFQDYTGYSWDNPSELPHVFGAQLKQLPPLRRLRMPLIRRVRKRLHQIKRVYDEACAMIDTTEKVTMASVHSIISDLLKNGCHPDDEVLVKIREASSWASDIHNDALALLPDKFKDQKRKRKTRVLSKAPRKSPKNGNSSEQDASNGSSLTAIREFLAEYATQLVACDSVLKKHIEIIGISQAEACVSKCESWQAEAKELLDAPLQVSAANSEVTDLSASVAEEVDKISSLISKGRALSVEMPELNQLRVRSKCLQWATKCVQIRNSTTSLIDLIDFLKETEQFRLDIDGEGSSSSAVTSGENQNTTAASSSEDNSGGKGSVSRQDARHVLLQAFSDDIEAVEKRTRHMISLVGNLRRSFEESVGPSLTSHGRFLGADLGYKLDNSDGEKTRRHHGRESSSTITPDTDASTAFLEVMDDGLYCECQLPQFDEEEMVMCNKCSRWFHVSCLGVGSNDIERIKMYNCEFCCAQTSSSYRYSSKLPSRKKRRYVGPKISALEKFVAEADPLVTCHEVDLVRYHLYARRLWVHSLQSISHRETVNMIRAYSQRVEAHVESSVIDEELEANAPESWKKVFDSIKVECFLLLKQTYLVRLQLLYSRSFSIPVDFPERRLLEDRIRLLLSIEKAGLIVEANEQNVSRVEKVLDTAKKVQQRSTAKASKRKSEMPVRVSIRVKSDGTVKFRIAVKQLKSSLANSTNNAECPVVDGDDGEEEDPSKFTKATVSAACKMWKKINTLTQFKKFSWQYMRNTVNELQHSAEMVELQREFDSISQNSDDELLSTERLNLSELLGNATSSSSPAPAASGSGATATNQTNATTSSGCAMKVEESSQVASSSTLSAPFAPESVKLEGSSMDIEPSSSSRKSSAAATKDVAVAGKNRKASRSKRHQKDATSVKSEQPALLDSKSQHSMLNQDSVNRYLAALSKPEPPLLCPISPYFLNLREKVVAMMDAAEDFGKRVSEPVNSLTLDQLEGFFIEAMTKFPCIHNDMIKGIDKRIKAVLGYMEEELDLVKNRVTASELIVFLEKRRKTCGSVQSPITRYIEREIEKVSNWSDRFNAAVDSGAHVGVFYELFVQAQPPNGLLVDPDDLTHVREFITPYCLCHQTWTAGALMLQCGTCEQWYHAECINLTGTDKHIDEQLSLPYECVICCQKKGTAHKFGDIDLAALAEQAKVNDRLLRAVKDQFTKVKKASKKKTADKKSVEPSAKKEKRKKKKVAEGGEKATKKAKGSKKAKANTTGDQVGGTSSSHVGDTQTGGDIDVSGASSADAAINGLSVTSGLKGASARRKRNNNNPASGDGKQLKRVKAQDGSVAGSLESSQVGNADRSTGEQKSSDSSTSTSNNASSGVGATPDSSSSTTSATPGVGELETEAKSRVGRMKFYEKQALISGVEYVPMYSKGTQSGTTGHIFTSADSYFELNGDIVIPPEMSKKARIMEVTHTCSIFITLFYNTLRLNIKPKQQIVAWQLMQEYMNLPHSLVNIGALCQQLKRVISVATINAVLQVVQPEYDVVIANLYPPVTRKLKSEKRRRRPRGYPKNPLTAHKIFVRLAREKENAMFIKEVMVRYLLGRSKTTTAHTPLPYAVPLPSPFERTGESSSKAGAGADSSSSQTNSGYAIKAMVDDDDDEEEAPSSVSNSANGTDEKTPTLGGPDGAVNKPSGENGKEEADSVDNDNSSTSESVVSEEQSDGFPDVVDGVRVSSFLGSQLSTQNRRTLYRALLERWRELSAEEQAPYHTAAAAALGYFEERLAAWLKENPEYDRLGRLRSAGSQDTSTQTEEWVVLAASEGMLPLSEPVPNLEGPILLGRPLTSLEYEELVSDSSPERLASKQASIHASYRKTFPEHTLFWDPENPIPLNQMSVIDPQSLETWKACLIGDADDAGDDSSSVPPSDVSPPGSRASSSKRKKSKLSPPESSIEPEVEMESKMTGHDTPKAGNKITAITTKRKKRKQGAEDEKSTRVDGGDESTPNKGQKKKIKQGAEAERNDSSIAAQPPNIVNNDDPNVPDPDFSVFYSGPFEKNIPATYTRQGTTTTATIKIRDSSRLVVVLTRRPVE